MLFRATTAGLIAFAFLGGSASAQKSDLVFKRIDANKDGKISKVEFEAVAQKVAQQGKGRGKQRMGGRLFERLDADNDGSLSPVEFQKLEALREQVKGRTGKGRGGR